MQPKFIHRHKMDTNDSKPQKYFIEFTRLHVWDHFTRRLPFNWITADATALYGWIHYHFW